MHDASPCKTKYCTTQHTYYLIHIRFRILNRIHLLQFILCDFLMMHGRKGKFAAQTLLKRVVIRSPEDLVDR